MSKVVTLDRWYGNVPASRILNTLAKEFNEENELANIFIIATRKDGEVTIHGATRDVAPHFYSMEIAKQVLLEWSKGE